MAASSLLLVLAQRIGSVQLDHIGIAVEWDRYCLEAQPFGIKRWKTPTR
jgi:hypothetical protein